MPGQHRTDRDAEPEQPSTARPVLTPLSEELTASPSDLRLFDGPGFRGYGYDGAGFQGAGFDGPGPDDHGHAGPGSAAPGFTAPSEHDAPYAPDASRADATIQLPPVQLGHRMERRAASRSASSPNSERPGPGRLVALGTVAAVAVLGVGGALLEQSLNRGNSPRRVTALPTAAAPSPTPATNATAAAHSSPATRASAQSAALSPSSAASEVLAAVRATASPSTMSTTAADGSLTLGDTGPQVTDLQSRLFSLHFTRRPPTGTYDSSTEHAVARFQSHYGITSDPSGVYGPATRAKLLSLTGG